VSESSEGRSSGNAPYDPVLSGDFDSYPAKAGAIYGDPAEGTAPAVASF
jgi:hypothetical protein